MMETLLIKIAAGVSIAGLLVGVGYLIATKQYVGQIAQLKAVMEQADAVAQETKLQQEATTDAISQQVISTTALVDNYRRLLRAKSAAQAQPVADSSKVVDARPDEQTLSLGDIEFRVACGADAIQVMNLQDWIRGQGFPIQK